MTSSSDPEILTYTWVCLHCGERRGGLNLEVARDHLLQFQGECIYEVKTCHKTGGEYCLVFNYVEFLTVDTGDKLFAISEKRRQYVEDRKEG